MLLEKMVVLCFLKDGLEFRETDRALGVHSGHFLLDYAAGKISHIISLTNLTGRL